MNGGRTGCRAVYRTSPLRAPTTSLWSILWNVLRYGCMSFSTFDNPEQNAVLRNWYRLCCSVPSAPLLTPVHLVRKAATEVSSKLRIQLWLCDHCSQRIQSANGCYWIMIDFALGVDIALPSSPPSAEAQLSSGRWPTHFGWFLCHADSFACCPRWSTERSISRRHISAISCRASLRRWTRCCLVVIAIN